MSLFCLCLLPLLFKMGKFNILLHLWCSFGNHYCTILHYFAKMVVKSGEINEMKYGYTFASIQINQIITEQCKYCTVPTEQDINLTVSRSHLKNKLPVVNLLHDSIIF